MSGGITLPSSATSPTRRRPSHIIDALPAIFRLHAVAPVDWAATWADHGLRLGGPTLSCICWACRCATQPTLPLFAAFDLRTLLHDLARRSWLSLGVGSGRRSAPQVFDLIDTEGVTKARLFTVLLKSNRRFAATAPASHWLSLHLNHQTI